MALISVIRRWHFRDGLSQREIARRTGLSRNTIRKYLNSQIVEPSYPKRKTSKKLDQYDQLLGDWLRKESKKPRKQRKSVKLLHRELVSLGFSGSYDRVAAFVRLWREEQKFLTNKQAYVPLKFAPGEAFQFDWGENWAWVGSRKVKLQVAHFKLSYSRAFYLRAYWTQTHEMLFDAHAHAFRVFKGVPERGIYDNMKTAVDKVGKGKLRTINKRFQAMASHYLFELEFCNPAAGWEKGQVEKNVQDSRNALWNSLPRFDSLDALNAWLEEACRQQWQNQLHPEYAKQTIEQIWQSEQSHLMAITAPFDGFIEHTKRVSSTCLVMFERNKYSVPASYANRLISLHVYPAKLVCIAEGKQVAEHKRVFSRDHNHPGQTVYDWKHYLLVAQRKPGALRNGAPFETLPDAFNQLQSQWLKRTGGDRDMVDILSLVLHHDEVLVEQAITESLKAGLTSKPHIINCLNRLLQPQTPEPVPLDNRLKLTIEPTIDTARYEQLRGSKYAH